MSADVSLIVSEVAPTEVVVKLDGLEMLIGSFCLKFQILLGPVDLKGENDVAVHVRLDLIRAVSDLALIIDRDGDRANRKVSCLISH